MLDLYEQESREDTARRPKTSVPEVGVFDGFVRGTALGTVRQLAVRGFATPLQQIGAIGAIAYDRTVDNWYGTNSIADGTSAQDRYFKATDEWIQSAIDRWTPKPYEVGVAGEIAGALLGLLPLAIASPHTAVAGFQLDTAAELARKGVDDWRAQAVGAAQGAGLGVGIWMPFLGSNLWQRMLVGGAGANVAQGVIMRGAAEEILRGHPAAKDFEALNLQDITLDTLLGLAFGAAAHYVPSWRAQSNEASARFRVWAQNITPQELAAIATLRQAQHSNQDSLPGKPAAPADLEAHVTRLKAALDQLERGETRVEVQGIGRPVEDAPATPAEALDAAPPPEDTPAPARAVEAQDAAAAAVAETRETGPTFEPDPARLKEMAARAEELVVEAGRIRAEEQLRVELPTDPAPVPAADRSPFLPEGVDQMANPQQARRIAEAIEARLREVGDPPERARANAAIWEARMRTRAERYGQSPAEWMRSLGLEIEAGEAARAGALKQDELSLDFTGQGEYGQGREAQLRAAESPQDLPATVAGGRPEQGWAGATRVRGAAGPLEVYRGGGQPLSAAHFGPEALGVASGNPSSGLGVWFTNTRSEAATYGAVESAFLDMRNPKLILIEDLPGFDTVQDATAFRETLRAQGHDGIIVEAKHLGGKTHFVAFEPERVIPSKDDDVSTLEQRPGPRWVSELSRQIEAAKMTQAPAKGWKDFLRGLKGVKPDEIKWSGIEEWLDLQTGKVTKDQVLGFLRENGVKVEEVQLGGGESQRTVRDAPLATKYAQYQLPGAKEGSYRELLMTLPAKEPNLTAREAGDRDSWIVREENSGQEWEVAGKASAAEAMREVQEKQGHHLKVLKAFQSGHFDEPNILAHVRFNERTDADGKRVLFVEEIQSDWAQKGKKAGFIPEQAKFDALEKEYNAVRAEKDALPADGSEQTKTAHKALLKRELELMDAMNAIHDIRRAGVPAAPFVGKTEAWVGLTLKRMIRYAAENGFERIAWTRGEQQVDRYTGALRKAVDAIEWTKTPEGVQIVGYKGRDFTEGARLRELERRAADRGLNDAESAEFAELRRAFQSQRNKVVDTTEREDALSDAIGKAMADRILNDPAQSGTIEGENIKVDDTGMATFYDRIVPNVAKDVLKKLGGGKVSAVDLSPDASPMKHSHGWTLDDSNGDQVAGPFASKAEAEAAMLGTHSGFEITPAMRDKAMEGMPLFQPAKGQITFADNRTIIDLFETADASTFQHETGHLFLQDIRDIAMGQNAPRQAIEDWGVLANWLGNEGGDITRAQHEQFARGWERYLAEGVAPSVELRGIFEQFREWLLTIYRKLRGLDVEISPEVRAVFDSMLATDAEIAAARTETDGPPAQRADTVEPPPPPGETGAEAGPVRPEGSKEAGKTTNPLQAAAQDVVAKDPNRLIRVGTNPDGSPELVTIREYLDGELEITAQAREDIQLIDAASNCLLTGGA